jgi:UDP-glucose 4-epimerase
LSKKKINILLGSSGFISLAFLKRKENINKKIYRLDKKKNTLFTKGYRFVQIDLSNFKKVDKLLKKISKNFLINEIWHFAANSDIQKGSMNPEIDLKDTFLTTFNIINTITINKIKIQKFIFASSSAIYGYKKNIKINENMKMLEPISNYGAMKLASENLISAFSKLQKIPCFVFRFPNVIGPNMTHGLIFDLIKKFKLNNKKLLILGNGTQQKQYLHVEDLLDAMYFVINSKKTKSNLHVYNIAGNDKGVSVKYIVNKFIAINKINPVIKYQKQNYGWPGDIPKFNYSIKKLKNLGWQPKINSSESVNKAIKENKIY